MALVNMVMKYREIPGRSVGFLVHRARITVAEHALSIHGRWIRSVVGVSAFCTSVQTPLPAHG
jgi:hypothetical protein